MAEEQRTALDDIRAFNQQRGPKCQAGILLAAMDPTLRETVQAAIDDPTIEMKAVVQWLRVKHDIAISYDSLSRHSKGDCRCG